ncbi:hypothetical protein DF034_18830 [Burkholderia anthina]|nr:hypothetical protein DF160_24060 [Burkholderia anthina]RQX81401.1 hypothetical protein DF034_18830 [Burkholderia anthina]
MPFIVGAIVRPRAFLAIRTRRLADLSNSARQAPDFSEPFSVTIAGLRARLSSRSISTCLTRAARFADGAGRQIFSSAAYQA